MKYRILEPGEWDKLKDLFVDSTFIPTPESATFAVAENDAGEIVGCLPLQLVLHMEPLVLRSPHVSFAKLYETLYNAVADHKGLHFYVFSDKEIIDKMAEHVGMKLTPYKVFEGEVK